ncbi:ribonuclease J [Candidatus Woesearchaeota archaeon CG_4_10_14_0_2_um_filter_33_13]|nr:MAG: ribonuclease J [Candidatus Woesearchaeota archaeon CG_4_10_14_0_2_um_filter_33_13]
MTIEVFTMGGFSEVGKNSTAIKIDNEVIILDMGLQMDNYIRYTEDREDTSAKTYSQLLKVGAVPDYKYIQKWQDKVLAIIPSHAHLDHIGAIPFAAPLFPQAQIICTPYTNEVIQSILKDDRLDIPNKIMTVNLNSTYKLSDQISLEFINATHSIPHAALVVIHTPYGKIVYANDYKFDRQPTLGKKTNYERLQEIGKEGVILLIAESLYADEHKKMPSESVAKQMLKDVMLGINVESKGMVVSTFSSHIARLKSIVEMGKALNRKIVFLGRSLDKYVRAAENVSLVNFKADAEIIGYRDKVEKRLRRISKEGKEKYLIVCTGHQGEPKAILSAMAREDLPFKFEQGDVVIFSCSVIPVDLNRDNRDKLEKLLKSKNVRIFRDVHVSGHAAREDHRDLIEVLTPKLIIPSHAGKDMTRHLQDLAKEMGYIEGETVRLMADGKSITLN